MGCVSNEEYVAAATEQAKAIRNQAIADTAIQVGLALWQRNTSRDITNLQNEIAEEQLALAEAVQEHAEKFWPEEKRLVDDAFGEQKAEPNYIGLSSEWKLLTSQAMEKSRLDWIDATGRLCIDISPCDEARFQRNSELANADAMSFAARQEEARAQEINDRRYERQYKVLQIGRGRLDYVLGFQSAALRAGGNASAILSNTINSALQLYGYWPSRNRVSQWGAGIQEKWGTFTQPFIDPVRKEPITYRSQRIPVERQPISMPNISLLSTTEMTKENEMEFADWSGF